MASGGEPSTGGEPELRTADEWLADVLDAERRGELLTAFDLAERGLAEHQDDIALKFRAVLALARAGSTEEAGRRFDEYGLGAIEVEDVAALRARIAKDFALAAEGEERRRRAARSAALYGAVFARTGGEFPGINAATLSMLAGDEDRARELARQVLEILRRGRGDTYYEAASEAEAQLLLGRSEEAMAALSRAATLHRGDHGAVATTRRQLRLVCEITGTDASILTALAGPRVVHFCGHRIAPENARGRFPAAAEEKVATRIAAVLREYPAAYAYGSLASGGDILWAEVLLAEGADLHVVLPFARGAFVETSVAPAGPGWVERFDRCLAAASALSYGTEDAFVADDVLYRYGSELAMGLAVLRAHHLDAEARQLAVWDGGPAYGDAGTAIDVATWTRRGLEVTVVPPNGAPAAAPGDDPQPAAPPSDRVVRAMLFADVRGFSKLTDEQLPRFADRVLGTFASVLERQGDDVCSRNTWGDGMYVVLSEAAAGAACALDLQGAMKALDLDGERLPTHLALRLAGHVGPVFQVRDPVLQTPSFMGSHVSRTARIEPVTPPETVYVTEPFAAALVLAGREEFVCDYVGHMPAAKDFGRLRMYRLRSRERLAAAGRPAAAR